MSELIVSIGDIPDDFVLVTDSQDVEHIYEHFGIPNDYEFGGLFVEVLDGDYGRVFGSRSFVPYVYDPAIDFRTWYSIQER